MVLSRAGTLISFPRGIKRKDASTIGSTGRMYEDSTAPPKYRFRTLDRLSVHYCESTAE